MAVTLNQRFALKNRNIPSLHHLDPHMTKTLSLGFDPMLLKKEISRLYCHIGNAFSCTICFSAAGLTDS